MAEVDLSEELRFRGVVRRQRVVALSLALAMLVVAGCRTENTDADLLAVSTSTPTASTASEAVDPAGPAGSGPGLLEVETPSAAPDPAEPSTAQPTATTTTAAGTQPTTATTQVPTTAQATTTTQVTTTTQATTTTTTRPTTTIATNQTTTSTLADGLHPDIVKVVQVVGRSPGGNSWKDSYSVGAKCYCATTFDHNIGGIEVDTPAGRKTVREVCERIGDGPGPQGRPIYNDIQCGNGPANNAGDEDDCPGRVDIGREGCGHIGPKWDLTVFE